MVEQGRVAAAAKIRSHDTIQGIKIGSESQVVSTYVDDVFLYLSNTLSSSSFYIA